MATWQRLGIFKPLIYIKQRSLFLFFFTPPTPLTLQGSANKNLIVWELWEIGTLQSENIIARSQTFATVSSFLIALFFLIN